MAAPPARGAACERVNLQQNWIAAKWAGCARYRNAPASAGHRSLRRSQGSLMPDSAFVSPAISRRVPFTPARCIAWPTACANASARGSTIALTDNITAAGRRADDLLAMTEGDELDICYFSSSYLAARVPSLSQFDRPFRFADRTAAYALLDGSAGRADRRAMWRGPPASACSDSGTTAFATSPTAAIRSAGRPTARACASARSTTPCTRPSSAGSASSRCSSTSRIWSRPSPTAPSTRRKIR